MSLNNKTDNKSKGTSFKTLNNSSALRVAALIGNRSIINHVSLLNTDSTNYKLHLCKLDELIVMRIIKLLRQKQLRSYKIKSSEIFSGLCSKQNWYYRILKAPHRISLILQQVLFSVIQDQQLCLSLLNEYQPKPLYLKTKRINHAEGKRLLRHLEVCDFLKFTTRYT